MNGIIENPARNIEVFYGPDYGYPTGWYWWPCQPGCLPDSEVPDGPFASFDEACQDIEELYGEVEDQS